MKKIFFVLAFLSAFILIGGVERASAQDGSMVWRGTVDDVIEIRIRNRNARTRVVRGKTYTDETYNFNGRMNRNSENVRVEKEDGRGKVYVFERPNRRNNWTTVIRVEDTKGGPDRYRFRVYWD